MPQRRALLIGFYYFCKRSTEKNFQSEYDSTAKRLAFSESGWDVHQKPSFLMHYPLNNRSGVIKWEFFLNSLGKTWFFSVDPNIYSL